MISVKIQINLCGDEFRYGQAWKVASYIENALEPMRGMHQLPAGVTAIRSEKTNKLIGKLVVTDVRD